jgi:hypothetical protein
MAIARHPLELIVQLESGDVDVDAVFVSLQDADVEIVQLFAFLKDQYPLVRRIAFAQHEATYANSTALQSCDHEMILWDSWNRDDFGAVLEDVLNRHMLPAESSWSDGRLFESQYGTDRSAISAIVQRYRHRIGLLVADAARDTADAEDVVQDTYLEIVRLLPAFDGACSPGEWVDRVTRSCIRSFGRRHSVGNAFHRRALARGTQSCQVWSQGALCR